MRNTIHSRGIAPVMILAFVAVLIVAVAGIVVYSLRDAAGDAVDLTGSDIAPSPTPTPVTFESVLSVRSAIKSRASGKALGEAVFSEVRPGKVAVSIAVGDVGDGPHPAHIHTGTCAELGGVRYPLTNVVDGSSESSLETTFVALEKEKPLALNIHKSPQESAVSIACGDLIFTTGAVGTPVDVGDPESGQGTDGTRADSSVFEPSGRVLAGRSSKLIDFNKADYDAAVLSGKLVLLYFFADWCPICREEFPRMEEVFNALESTDVIGFRVNYKDSSTDPDEVSLARKFGVAYQHTKVFTRSGTLVSKSPEGWSSERYVMEINSHLALE